MADIITLNKEKLAAIKGELERALVELPIEHTLTPSMIDQAGYRQRYGSLHAKACALADSAKMLLDQTRAEIELDVRKNPGEYGLNKVTEGAIDAVVVLDAAVQEAGNFLIESKSLVEDTKSTVTAFDHRRDMIVQLSKHRLIEVEGEMHSVRNTAGAAASVKERFA